jgi:hypothetical protein
MRRASIAVLTLFAASWCGRLSAQVAIRDIRLTLDPTTYNGPCPVHLRAHVVFESNYPARVDEDDWGWNFGRLAPHSWDVPGGHLRTSGRETTVDTTLTLPRAGEAGGLLHEGSVIVIMALNPTISNKVNYSVRCAPAVTIDPNLVKPIQPGPTIALQKVPTLPPPSGGGAGPAVRVADLVPEILDPFAFRFAVRNVGDGAAGPSSVLLRCRATSGGGNAKGGCPSIPALARFFDAGLGGFVVDIPPVPAGATQAVPLPALGPLTWAPGTYEFTAVADVRHAVPERNEGNNTATRAFPR